MSMERAPAGSRVRWKPTNASLDSSGPTPAFPLTTELQYNVLRILRGAGAEGLCGREISERLVSQVPDVSRLLDRMEGMQLLRRERDATDRRHVTARITSKGLRLLDETTPALEAFERERFAQFEAERLQQIIDGLADVRDAL